jgi:hypothetical protein
MHMEGTHESGVNQGAESGLALLAVEAPPAGDVKRHHHAVAFFEKLHIRTVMSVVYTVLSKAEDLPLRPFRLPDGGLEKIRIGSKEKI